MPASPAAQALAIQTYLHTSQTTISNLEREAQRLDRQAAIIRNQATGPLTEQQNAEIDKLEESADLIRSKMSRLSAIENANLNSPDFARGLQSRIETVNRQITSELRELDSIVAGINSLNKVVNTLTSLLLAASAVSGVFV